MGLFRDRGRIPSNSLATHAVLSEVTRSQLLMMKLPRAFVTIRSAPIVGTWWKRARSQEGTRLVGISDAIDAGRDRTRDCRRFRSTA